VKPDDRSTEMAKRTTTSIARKAQAKAEADFATWLMLAKLGSFDDLPKDAQAWLEGYQARLGQMPESEAMLATIREIYAAYYTGMGGDGNAPALARDLPPTPDNVVALKDVRAAKAARPAASTAPRSRLPFPPLLIFAAMVAALVAIKFAFGS